MAIYKPEKDPFFIGEMGFVGAIFRSRTALWPPSLRDLKIAPTKRSLLDKDLAGTNQSAY